MNNWWYPCLIFIFLMEYYLRNLTAICYYCLIFIFTKKRMFFVILARFESIYELSQHLLVKIAYSKPLTNICQFYLVMLIEHQHLIFVLCFLIQLYHQLHHTLYFSLYNIYFAFHNNHMSHKYCLFNWSFYLLNETDFRYFSLKCD